MAPAAQPSEGERDRGRHTSRAIDTNAEETALLTRRESPKGLHLLAAAILYHDAVPLRHALHDLLRDFAQGLAGGGESVQHPRRDVCTTSNGAGPLQRYDGGGSSRIRGDPRICAVISGAAASVAAGRNTRYLLLGETRIPIRARTVGMRNA